MVSGRQGESEEGKDDLSSRRLGHSLCSQAGNGEGTALARLKLVGGEDPLTMDHRLKSFPHGRWKCLSVPSTLLRCQPMLVPPRSQSSEE